MLSRANALVLLNTVGLSLAKTGLAMGLALFMAWIVARTDTPHRETLEVLITLPFYIPPILTAMAWGMRRAAGPGLRAGRGRLHAGGCRPHMGGPRLTLRRP